MFHTLVHGENRKVAAAAQSPVLEYALQVDQHLVIPIADRVESIDAVRTRQVQPFSGDLGSAEREQVFSFESEVLLDGAQSCCGRCCHVDVSFLCLVGCVWCAAVGLCTLSWLSIPLSPPSNHGLPRRWFLPRRK